MKCGKPLYITCSNRSRITVHEFHYEDIAIEKENNEGACYKFDCYCMEIWEIDATMIASLSTHIQQINIYQYRKI